VSAAVRPAITAMAGYMPGEQPRGGPISKLNTNENPYPPSPRVLAALQAAITGDALRKYPDPVGTAFRHTAGQVLGIDPDSILIGNGSDDVLTILVRTFVPEGGTIAALMPGYTLYRSLAEIQGARFIRVPFTPDWDAPADWPTAHLSFLTLPNSPTGTLLPVDTVERIVQATTGAVVIDEAYAEFAERHHLGWTQRPNVVVTRTFSKYYALAGIRFGFAVARPELVRELVKVKDSYNCDVLSLVAATAAIADQAYYADLKAKLLTTRTHTAIALTSLGFVVTPSHTNFLWCRHERPVQPMYAALKASGILVRYMNYPDYGDGLRITIGTDAEMEQLLTALHELMAQ
jgi:histidinol-phosphate aminotransferase